MEFIYSGILTFWRTGNFFFQGNEWDIGLCIVFCKLTDFCLFILKDTQVGVFRFSDDCGCDYKMKCIEIDIFESQS